MPFIFMTDGIPLFTMTKSKAYMAIPAPTTGKRASHRQAQQTPPVDDQDGQRLPNTHHH